MLSVNPFRHFSITNKVKEDFNNDIHKQMQRQESTLKPLYRICLTGGPCSGKSTATAKL